MQIYFLPLIHSIMGDRETELLNYVSTKRQETISRYRFPIDQKLSLYAELLALRGISNALSVPFSRITILHEKMQKPKLASPYEIDFNFSHTHKAILCGIATCGKIGVDIEPIKVPPLNVMKHVFHPAEIAYVESAAGEKKETRFFEIWTRKEAYTKYLGTGLSIELTCINTLDADFNCHCRTWQQETYICSVYTDVDRDFQLSICSETDIYEYFSSHSV